MKTEIDVHLPDHWAEDALRLFTVAVQLWLYVRCKRKGAPRE